MAVVGVDGCAKGWIAVVLDERHSATAHLLPDIDAIEGAVRGVEVIAIDIPIGVPTAGRRYADLLARAEVGERANSVFVTPVRAALNAPTHKGASEINRRVTGAGISQQAFALKAKILEVERWLADAPCPVFEVHPELCFTRMCGAPATAPKKTWHGMTERRRALAANGVVLDDIDAAVGASVAADDVLDAAVAAWSARRLRDGIATSLPDPPDVDETGRQVAIWA